MQYHRIKNANGTFKTTQRARFAAIDADILKEISQPVSFLDVGCSSGETTVDFLDLAQAEGVRIDRTEAADLSLWGQMPAEGLVRPVSVDGRRIGMQVAGHVFWEHCGRLQKLMLYPVLYRCLSGIAGRAEGRPTVPFPLHVSDPRVSFFETNVMAKNPFDGRSFTFIRVANVLNEHMFTPAQIKTALAYVKGALVEGGHLFIARTKDHQHHGGLYVRRNGALQVVREFGCGSELKGLIEDA